MFQHSVGMFQILQINSQEAIDLNRGPCGLPFLATITQCKASITQHHNVPKATAQHIAGALCNGQESTFQLPTVGT